jgi:hypothetical protein
MANDAQSGSMEGALRRPPVRGRLQAGVDAGQDKGERRDVQRRLTGLGFDTKVTGKFDENTRGP